MLQAASMAAKTVADGVADRNLLYNRTRSLRKIRGQTPGQRPAWMPPPFDTPAFQLPKNRSFQAGGPWGHSLYFLSMNFPEAEVQVVLSECCQKFIHGFGALSLQQKALRH